MLESTSRRQYLDPFPRAWDARHATGDDLARLPEVEFEFPGLRFRRGVNCLAVAVSYPGREPWFGYLPSFHSGALDDVESNRVLGTPNPTTAFVCVGDSAYLLDTAGRNAIKVPETVETLLAIPREGVLLAGGLFGLTAINGDGVRWSFGSQIDAIESATVIRQHAPGEIEFVQYPENPKRESPGCWVLDTETGRLLRAHGFPV